MELLPADQLPEVPIFSKWGEAAFIVGLEDASKECIAEVKNQIANKDFERAVIVASPDQARKYSGIGTVLKTPADTLRRKISVLETKQITDEIIKHFVVNVTQTLVVIDGGATKIPFLPANNQDLFSQFVSLSKNLKVNLIITSPYLGAMEQFGNTREQHASVIKLFKSRAFTVRSPILEDKIYLTAQRLVQEHTEDRPVYIDLKTRKIHFAYHPYSQRIEP